MFCFQRVWNKTFEGTLLNILNITTHRKKSKTHSVLLLPGNATGPEFKPFGASALSSVQWRGYSLIFTSQGCGQRSFFLNCRAVLPPRTEGGAFLPAMHFRARGGRPARRRSSRRVVPEAGAGPGQVGPQLRRAALGLSAGARQVYTHRAKHAERACTRMCAVLGARFNWQRNVKAQSVRKESDNWRSRGSRRPSVAATKLPGAPRPLRLGPTGLRAPRGGQPGSQPAQPVCSASAAHCCPPQLPRPALPDPLPFPLPDRDGRGLPRRRRWQLAQASLLGPLEPRAGVGTWAGCRRSGEPPGFPVSRSPRRKGEGQGAAFPCAASPGSTCAACGFLGTRGPRPGLAQPAACLELDRSGLRRRAWVEARKGDAGAPSAVGRVRPGSGIRDAWR